MTAPNIADDTTLTETLRLAVPELVNELLAVPQAERERQALRWSTDGGAAVGGFGDLLIFRTGTAWNPRRALAFNRLARGLAAAVVLHPTTGVDVAGLHWCLRRDCCRCNPPRVQTATPLADLNAQLEALDAEYRALAGLPPWEPQPSPVPASTPPARLTAKRRPIITVNLPEVA
ncbi:hypothetical protein ACIBCR_14895 [Micromonospora echinospora]|uniref:hypothetical protein n=1 Tax=Micromonospora echinospora TaxID=1877 RepID=UPI003796CDA3